ncbi:two-component system, response regulator YcbB [[Clostridium] aminophilum]|uniref:Stage 0 sporulation protein A homolog n=1 Tax=[Clostridium] aminophilum TaxID=1526 RepID=A0A1I0DGK3_9FIRM|nr:DNA-binding domain-containing protein [[Clostridium] aminophilum]SET30912.1 two-component system, response regulator YcbB [[Clostridium] aminophilum]
MDKMEIYIVEDDLSVISILEDIIEDNDLGSVSGSSGENGADIDEILIRKPDVILIDYLMPGKDGMQVVRELKEKGCRAKFVMISQVSSKDMVGKAYDAGVDFFISKPINLIEVKSVIQNVESQLKNEKTIANLRTMFMNEISDMSDNSDHAKEVNNVDYEKKVRYILNRIGMSGEKGAEDIVKICEYLKSSGQPIATVSIGRLCEIISDAPKNMEQRIRRAISVGMSNLAHLGVEDFMNETFTEYSNSLFPFEEIRSEMDHIRGKSRYGGKVSIKKFIDALMLEADRK